MKGKKHMIRIGNEHDCEAIYDLVCELEAKAMNKETFLQIYDKQCQDHRYLCLVYEEAGYIVGLCNLRFEEQLHHCEKIAEILELSVTSDDQNHGIGNMLLAKACEVAKQNGCAQIEACSNQKRNKAHHFYESAGICKSHYKFTKRL